MILIAIIFYTCYSLIWNITLLRRDLIWLITSVGICLTSIYIFSWYPKRISISEKNFMPFIPQNPIEYITRKYKILKYVDITHVIIYKEKNETIMIDLKLKSGKNFRMRNLEYNIELANYYEEIFRTKLGNDTLSIIEK